jgi:hypothetical protein
MAEFDSVLMAGLHSCGRHYVCFHFVKDTARTSDPANVVLECGCKQALHVMKLLLLYFSVLSQSHVKLLGLETGGVSA